MSLIRCLVRHVYSLSSPKSQFCIYLPVLHSLVVPPFFLTPSPLHWRNYKSRCPSFFPASTMTVSPLTRLPPRAPRSSAQRNYFGRSRPWCELLTTSTGTCQSRFHGQSLACRGACGCGRIEPPNARLSRLSPPVCFFSVVLSFGRDSPLFGSQKPVPNLHFASETVHRNEASPTPYLSVQQCRISSVPMPIGDL